MPEGRPITDYLGPKLTLPKAMAALTQLPADLGIDLRVVGADYFADLMHTRIAPEFGFRLGSTYDLHINPGLGDDNARFIVGYLHGTFPVTTQAVRLHRWPASNLAAQANGLGCVYDDPAPAMARGEYCVCTCPSAPLITGAVCRPGALFIHPAFRRKGLARHLSRLSRAVAFDLWDCDFFWSFVNAALYEGAAAQAMYGYPRAGEPGLTMNLRDIQGPAYLLWMSKAEQLAELESVVAGELRKEPAA